MTTVDYYIWWLFLKWCLTAGCNGCFCQVLPAVCELLLLWWNGDWLLLHPGAEGGASTHPQQIPSLHFLCHIPHRLEHHVSNSTLTDTFVQLTVWVCLNSYYFVLANDSTNRLFNVGFGLPMQLCWCFEVCKCGVQTLQDVVELSAALCPPILIFTKSKMADFMTASRMSVLVLASRMLGLGDKAENKQISIFVAQLRKFCFLCLCICSKMGDILWMCNTWSKIPLKSQHRLSKKMMT